MKNPIVNITGYRLAYDSGWKNPCILECLLRNDHKCKAVNKLLSALKLRIIIYSDNKWFDIVE